MIWPERVLEKGERLLLDATPGSAAYVLYGIFVWTLFLQLGDLLMLLPAFSGRFDPWTVVVTDRRVLVRKRMFAKHYTDIHLSDIRRVEHDRQGGRRILIGEERALQIRCNEQEATEILQALKGAWQPRRTFWQRLWRR